MKETVCSFEMSQNTFPPTQHHNPQDKKHRQNIKTQNITSNFELR